MVQTRSNNTPPEGSSNPDQIAAQLAAIASRLESFESLKDDVAALKSLTNPKQKPHNRFSRYDDGSFEQHEEGQSSWRRSHQYRPSTKIVFPTFSSGDPRGWILKAEKFFQYYDIPDDEKVDVASMHLEGDALDLYSWLSADQPITFWEELVSAFTKNFGPAEFQNPDEHLCSIKQTGSVQEYRQEFAKRSSRVLNWPDHCLLGVFLNGLKEELKADVRIHKPRTVYSAMSLALEFESKLGKGSGQQLKVFEASKSASSTNPASSAITSPKSAAQPAVTPSPAPSLRISDEEKQSRFTKGLCFRCGEKFGPGHRCKSGTFKALEIADVGEETATISELNSLGEMADISLHALFGQATPTTMKLQGVIGTTEVLVLIDSGSTHNFISDKLVNNLQIISQLITPFGVQIGDGNVIRCNRMCKDVLLKLSDLLITQDFYPLALGAGGADVVLGIQWLATLNTVQANWAKNLMIFTVKGQEHKLQGLQSEVDNSATCHHLAIEPFEKQLMIETDLFSQNRLEDKSFYQGGSNDKNLAGRINGTAHLNQMHNYLPV